ncbi:hypothetical protein [Streptomyces goshikiensis]|uniref:hypothetical protein n=1 Tax=Streptomyces goshikiensis TaxID=1942 RepID=UPI0036CC92EA
MHTDISARTDETYVMWAAARYEAFAAVRDHRDSYQGPELRSLTLHEAWAYSDASARACTRLLNQVRATERRQVTWGVSEPGYLMTCAHCGEEIAVTAIHYAQLLAAPCRACARCRPPTPATKTGPAIVPGGCQPSRRDSGIRYCETRTTRHDANCRFRRCPAPTPHWGSTAGQGPSTWGPRSPNPTARPHSNARDVRREAWGPAVETNVTKTGNDHLKARARRIARDSGRRFPDVLAELRHAPARQPRDPSKELVLRCRGLAHIIDGGRCAQPAGHPGQWTWCGPDPHVAVHVWQGFVEARDAAEHAKHEAWLASLTPEERAAHEAEQEDAYWAQMAEDAQEPYDPEAERNLEYTLDAADEARWAADEAAREEAGGYDDTDGWDEDYR